MFFYFHLFLVNCSWVDWVFLVTLEGKEKTNVDKTCKGRIMRTKYKMIFSHRTLFPFNAPIPSSLFYNIHCHPSPHWLVIIVKKNNRFFSHEKILEMCNFSGGEANGRTLRRPQARTEWPDLLMRDIWYLSSTTLI